jgi:hypothetical protein
MRKLKNFTEHVNEGAVMSKGVDFMKLEEICAKDFPGSDFLPTNVREWDRLAIQLERLKKLYKSYVVDGKSVSGFDPRTGPSAVNDWVLGGGDFKHSLLEVNADIHGRDKAPVLAAFRKCNFPIVLVYDMLQVAREKAKDEHERFGETGEIDMFVKNGLAKQLAASVKALDKLNDKLDGGWDLDGLVKSLGFDANWFVEDALGVKADQRRWMELKDLTNICVLRKYENSTDGSDSTSREREKVYRLLCHVMAKMGISLPDAVAMYDDVIMKVKAVMKDNLDHGLERTFKDYFVAKQTADSMFSIPELKRMRASGKRKLMLEFMWERAGKSRPIPREYFDFIDEIRVASMAGGPKDREVKSSLIEELPEGKTLFVNSPVLMLKQRYFDGKIKMPKDSVVMVEYVAQPINQEMLKVFSDSQHFAYHSNTIRDELKALGVTEDRLHDYNTWKRAREAKHPGSYDYL